jgi:L-iditol 2-dehydrogenase
MRVAMYYNNKDIRIEDKPIPEIGEGELLVKVMASGICGSDVMEWYRIKKAPLVLGHEVTGIIEKVGEGVKGFKKGDRVMVTHHVPCDNCHYCLQGEETVCETLRRTNFDPGGFSEYLRVPNINVEKGTFLLPKEISFEEGTFIEPLACVVRGQRKAMVKEGQNVLIIGGGISGLLHLQLAKVKGAERVIVTDINLYRLKMAEKFGADEVIDAKKNAIKEVVDRVIVCTGAKKAINKAFDCIDRGGTILFFAPTEPEVKISIPFNDLWFKCVSLITTYAAVKKDIEEAINLIQEKKINVKDMITHCLSLEETGKGFQLVADAQESLKVIIKSTFH